MNFKKFKNLQNKTKNDYKYKGNIIIINEITANALSKSGIIKKLSDRGDIESLFLYSLHGFTKSILFLFGYIISFILIPIYYFVKLIKILIKNENIYSFVIYPLVIVFDLIITFQAWNVLYDNEKYTMSEKEKIEYKSKLQSANEYEIWDTFWK